MRLVFGRMAESPNNIGEDYPEMTVRDDHVRFRELVREDIRYRLKHHPVLTENDWIVRCYASRDEFQREFPDSADRATLLDKLAEIQASIRAELLDLDTQPPKDYSNLFRLYEEGHVDPDSFEMT